MAEIPQSQFVQPRRSSAGGKYFCLLTALLTTAAISLHAEEPSLTLATVKNYSLPVTAASAPSFNREKKPAPAFAPLKLEDETEMEFLSRTHLEKQTSIGTRTHNFNFKVGYGEIWHGQSEIEKIQADRRPTSFAYFKARFSF